MHWVNYFWVMYSFFCTLFIDNPALDFGVDLQKLFINTIQSFLQKPDLTERKQTAVDDTLSYFSGQRARMLFGLTSGQKYF